MTDREELAQWFSEQMLTKLKMNEHKGHWSTVSMNKLFDLLADEMAELAQAILIGDPKDVILEAADCGNVLAFIADRYREPARQLAAWASGR